MRVWRCDRCGRDFSPFAFNSEYFIEPPQVLNYDLCERCYKDIYIYVRLTQPPKWYQFHFDAEKPKIGQTIELYCPDNKSANIVVWSQEYEDCMKNGGYALYEWRPWQS